MLLEGQRFCSVEPSRHRGGGISKWGKTDLKWHLDKPLPGISLDAQTLAYTIAFQQWQDVCGLTFEQTMDHSEGDIHIYTKRIDGPSGTLAYAFLPGSGTTSPLDTFYDTSERWDTDSSDGIRGIDLVAVVCHEGGHLIGLDHLGRGNLLAPFYTPDILKPQAGDIAEAVRRYGPNTTPTPPTDPDDPEESFASVLIDIRAGFVPGIYSAKLGWEDKR